MDSRAGSDVIQLLEELNQEQGITLVVVTHDPDLSERAGRQIRMLDGRIQQDSRS